MGSTVAHLTCSSAGVATAVELARCLRLAADASLPRAPSGDEADGALGGRTAAAWNVLSPLAGLALRGAGHASSSLIQAQCQVAGCCVQAHVTMYAGQTGAGQPRGGGRAVEHRDAHSGPLGACSPTLKPLKSLSQEGTHSSVRSGLGRSAWPPINEYIQHRAYSMRAHHRRLHRPRRPSQQSQYGAQPTVHRLKADIVQTLVPFPAKSRVAGLSTLKCVCFLLLKIAHINMLSVPVPASRATPTVPHAPSCIIRCDTVSWRRRPGAWQRLSASQAAFSGSCVALDAEHKPHSRRRSSAGQRRCTCQAAQEQMQVAITGVCAVSWHGHSVFVIVMAGSHGSVWPAASRCKLICADQDWSMSRSDNLRVTVDGRTVLCTTDAAVLCLPSSSQCCRLRCRSHRFVEVPTVEPTQALRIDTSLCDICLAGATGLVGSRLAAKLASQGHGVRVLTRDVGRARGKLPYGRLEFFGPSDWQRGLAGATGVVNLAGVQSCSPKHPTHCLCSRPVTLLSSWQNLVD